MWREHLLALGCNPVFANSFREAISYCPKIGLDFNPKSGSLYHPEEGKYRHYDEKRDLAIFKKTLRACVRYLNENARDELCWLRDALAFLFAEQELVPDELTDSRPDESNCYDDKGGFLSGLDKSCYDDKGQFLSGMVIVDEDVDFDFEMFHLFWECGSRLGWVRGNPTILRVGCWPRHMTEYQHSDMEYISRGFSDLELLHKILACTRSAYQGTLDEKSPKPRL